MATNQTGLGKRQARRAARTAEMLDAAMEIAVTEGIEQLTIGNLAAKLGAAVGALYRYFPSKAALMISLEKRAILGLYDDVASTFERAEQAVDCDDERVAALTLAMVIMPTYLADAAFAPDRHRLIDSIQTNLEPALPDDDARNVVQALDPLIALIAGKLDGAVQIGALRAGDGVQRTHVLWAVMLGLDHFRVRDRIQPKHLRVDALTARALQALFIGWGGDPKLVGLALAQLGRIAEQTWGCRPG